VGEPQGEHAPAAAHWLFSFLGNCAGAIATAGSFHDDAIHFRKRAVGLNALAIANAKASLDFFLP